MKGGGGGELQRRLPEGVKLRNKKKKPSKRTAVQRGLKLQSQQDLSGLALFPGLFKKSIFEQAWEQEYVLASNKTHDIT